MWFLPGLLILLSSGLVLVLAWLSPGLYLHRSAAGTSSRVESCTSDPQHGPSASTRSWSTGKGTSQELGGLKLQVPPTVTLYNGPTGSRRYLGCRGVHPLTAHLGVELQLWT